MTVHTYVHIFCFETQENSFKLWNLLKRKTILFFFYVKIKIERKLIKTLILQLIFQLFIDIFIFILFN